MSILPAETQSPSRAHNGAGLSPHRSAFLPHPSPEAVAKFKSLYLQEYGVDLDAQEVLRLATSTLQFVYLRITPCPGYVPATDVPNSTP